MAFLKPVAAAVVTLSLAGCASLTSPLAEDYTLGDNTRHYCSSVDPKIRAAGRGLAASAGVQLIDLCKATDLSLLDLGDADDGE